MNFTADNILQILNLTLTFIIGVVLTLYIANQEKKHKSKEELIKLYFNAKRESRQYMDWHENSIHLNFVNSIFYWIFMLFNYSDEYYGYWLSNIKVYDQIKENLLSFYKIDSIKLNISDHDNIRYQIELLNIKLGQKNDKQIEKLKNKVMSILINQGNLRHQISMLKFQKSKKEDLINSINGHKNGLITPNELEMEILHILMHQQHQEFFLKIIDDTQKSRTIINEYFDSIHKIINSM